LTESLYIPPERYTVINVASQQLFAERVLSYAHHAKDIDTQFQAAPAIAQ
jgi:hypothetical protein